MTVLLHQLSPQVARTPRKRVGRGSSAGGGTTAGRGTKGQKARSGGSIPPGFEGGRTTLIVQTPKARGKGFRSLNPEFQVVSLEKLNVFLDGDKVTAKALRAKGLASDRGPIKILGQGQLSRKLQVAVATSASAKAIIEKAGGQVLES